MSEELLDFGEDQPAREPPPAADEDLADEIALRSVKETSQPRHEPASDYLHKRIRLLTLQIKHYEEDFRLRHKSERAHITSQRLRITVQILFIITGLVLVTAVAVLIWSASHSESIIVDAFDTPPSLAQRGETGRVVAGEVLDELTKLQTATRARAKKFKLKNAWTGDIKIDIPETGVSLGELERTMRENLGRDRHIGGSVVETPDGKVALTVRGDGVLAKTFTGAPADLPKLTQQAAEYIYGEAEPYLYASYLLDAGRFVDTDAFIKQAYPQATDAERPLLANAWGNALGSLARYTEAVDKYHLAVSLQPRLWLAWGNLVAAVTTLEGEEAAYRVGVEMRKAAMVAPSDDQPRLEDWGNLDIITWDLPAAMKDYGQNSNSVQIVATLLADNSALLHDWNGVEQYMTAAPHDDPTAIAEAKIISAYRAMDRADYAAAIPPLEDFYKQWLDDTNIQYTFTDYPCLLALAYGMTGRMAEAEALFKRIGRSVKCYSYRADVIDHAGDWRGAVAAYRAAIALAPSLPFAYDHWGLALMRHGDLNGAAAAFGESNKRQPHWADPLKHWGDVLMRQHRPAEALDKYKEALKYAPHWDALQAAVAKTASR